MRNLFKKLDNPFLLAAEGFIAGAILFWATTPDSVQARADRPTAELEASAARSSSL